MTTLAAYCPYEDKGCDCFALLANGECYALQDTEFKDGVCKFYKTADRVSPEVMVKINKMNKSIRKRMERRLK